MIAFLGAATTSVTFSSNHHARTPRQGHPGPRRCPSEAIPPLLSVRDRGLQDTVRSHPASRSLPLSSRGFIGAAPLIPCYFALESSPGYVASASMGALLV